MWKKITCLMLSSIIFLSCTSVSFAKESPLSSSGKAVTESMTLLSSPEELESAFGPQAVTIDTFDGETGSPQLGITTYDYEIQIPEDDANGTANITFTMDVSGDTYIIFTTGDIYVLKINEEYTLLQGILKGEVTISGKRYTVKLGLQKLTSCDSISVGVALTPEDFYTNENVQQLFFCFGTSVMTEDFIPAYLSYIDIWEDEISEETIADIAPYGTMEYVTSNIGTFTSNHFFNGSGNASILMADRDTSNKRIYLRLGSFAYNIKANQFPQHEFISAGVHEYSIGIERIGSDTSIASIEGVKGIMDASNGGNAAKGLLTKLLSGCLKLVSDYAGMDLTGLTAILNSSGSASFYDTGDISELNVTLGDPTKNFDNKSTYFPVAFNILTNGLTGYYRGYSTLTYSVNTATALLPIETKRITTANIKIS